MGYIPLLRKIGVNSEQQNTALQLIRRISFNLWPLNCHESKTIPNPVQSAYDLLIAALFWIYTTIANGKTMANNSAASADQGIMFKSW